MFSVTIGKPDTKADVQVGPFSACNLAWMELCNLIEKAQDDTVENLVLEGDRTPAEAAQANAEFVAYGIALESALEMDWSEPGETKAVLADGDIVFAVAPA